MKHKFIILALGLGFLASSCNDLDLVPLSEASTENWLFFRRRPIDGCQ